MNRTSEQGLIRPALAALKWNYLGVAARTASSFIIGIVLARILGPKPFGEVAVAWLVIGLGNLMADCGFGAALVQRRDLSTDDIRFVFTAQLGLGILLTSILAGAAPLVASIFRQPEVTPIVRALALVFALQGFGLTSQNLLKRDLAFRKLQIAQVVSYLVGYLALGIPLAFLGFGVWSLVAAQLAQSCLNSALLFWAAGHSLRPRLLHPRRELTSFGGKVIAVNLVNFAIGNVDTAFVSRAFGAVSLGLYNRSMVLMMAPTNAVVATLQAVLFPVYSRAQERPDALRRGFLTSIAAVAVCIFPVFFTVAVIPRTVIEGLYGDRWIAAVPLLVPIALSRPFFASMALAGPLLWGVGKVEQELRVQIAVVLTMIPALLLASRFSLGAVAWAVFAVLTLQSILMTRPALQAAGVGWRDAGRVIRGAALLSAALALIIWPLDHIAFAHLASPLRLLADACTAATSSAALVLALPQWFLCAELTRLICVHFGPAPGWVKHLVLRNGGSTAGATAA